MDLPIIIILVSLLSYGPGIDGTKFYAQLSLARRSFITSGPGQTAFMADPLKAVDSLRKTLCFVCLFVRV